MKNKYLYGIIAIVAVGTAGYFVLAGSGSKEPKYRTDKVSRGSIVVQVRATGTINPVKTVEVGSQVSGIISKINVDYNSEVRQGQVIAVIDSTLLYASVKEARANLARNQAQVNQAERDLKRTTDLFAKELVATADLDAAKTAFESAKAQLMQTEAALDRALVNLRYVVIRSPIDGVVISRDVDVGQTVAASLQTPKLFSIANDLKRMQVEASVDEADIGQIKLDQAVSFTVDAYPDDQFRGRVSQVRLAPVTVQNVVTYTVVIEVPNADLKLRPGMTATVSILIDKRDDVLRVPSLALRFQPPADVADKMKADVSPSDAKAAPPEANAGPDGKNRAQMSGQDGGRPKRDSSSWKEWGKGNHDWKEGKQAGGSDDGRQQKKFSKIWIMRNGKDLVAVRVGVGLNDSRFTEILDGELKEGDEIILGAQGAEMAGGMNGQQNPFQSRPMGGGGRRGM